MRSGAVFPWRGDNRFELLVDGARFFPRMLDAIAAAQRQVELELYLVEDGKCFDQLRTALVDAAHRGVQVRCLFDSFGCLKLSPANRQALVDAGVQLRLYNPVRWRRGLRNLFRDHRKILLVDDLVGYVGGTGATDEFWNPDQPQDSWHEVMVEMHGPLLGDWRSLFEYQWRCCGRRQPSAEGWADWPMPPPASTATSCVRCCAAWGSRAARCCSPRPTSCRPARCAGR